MTDYVFSSPEITRRIMAVLEAATEELGIKRVYYGDQNLIPDFPAICVESGRKERRIEALQRFEVSLSTTIYIYFGEVRSSELNLEAVEELTEEVEAVLHRDYNLGGAVIFGFVTANEPGYKLREQVMIKTSRLTWEGVSRQNF